MLSNYVDDNYWDWDECIFFVMMVYRVFQYELIGFILNMFMLGREFIILLDIVYDMFLFWKQVLKYDWVWVLFDWMEWVYYLVR